jgi:hypothetical protein
MSKIYVASSWRNILQPLIVQLLRSYGHKVYDFRNPVQGNYGFAWHEIDSNWKKWSSSEYRDALASKTALTGFNLDKTALDWADECLLVLPCGRSAHLEAGYMIGQSKPVTVYIPDNEQVEPELMYLLAETILITTDELIQKYK